MKTQIVTIGNSKGIRIPKILLEQSKLSGEVELEVKGESIIILPAKKPRANWDAAFKQAKNDNDEVIGDDVQNKFDEEEWEW
jgi:antitoxin MazE